MKKIDFLSVLPQSEVLEKVYIAYADQRFLRGMFAFLGLKFLYRKYYLHILFKDGGHQVLLIPFAAKEACKQWVQDTNFRLKVKD